MTRSVDFPVPRSMPRFVVQALRMPYESTFHNEEEEEDASLAGE
jgi:hypothetical protein